jgi:hypothetical protein
MAQQREEEMPLKVAPRVDAQWSRFLAGGLASGTAEILTLPIDCTKVRLQAQRAAGAQYSGMLDAVGKIAREEGPTALWKGVTPALMRQVSYTSVSMVLYEPFRDYFGASNSGPNGEVPFANKFLAGGTAGAIGISFANPCVRLLLLAVVAVMCSEDNRELLLDGQGGRHQGADAGRPRGHTLPRRRGCVHQDLCA